MVRVVVFHRRQFLHASTALIDAQRKLPRPFARPCNTKLQMLQQGHGFKPHRSTHCTFPSRSYAVHPMYLTQIDTYAYKPTIRPMYIYICPHTHTHTHKCNIFPSNDYQFCFHKHPLVMAKTVDSLRGCVEHHHPCHSWGFFLQS